MSPSSSDTNLLFGVFALQIDAIRSEQLIEALQQWMKDKSATVGEILRSNGAISEEQFSAIGSLVHSRLIECRSDATLSFAPLNSRVSSLGQRLSDSELTMSLRQAGGSSQAFDKTLPSKGAFGHGSFQTENYADQSRYQIRHLHDEGGLGCVFLAEDKQLDRDVALKVLKPDSQDDLDCQSRFVAEAEVTGGLEHPGIVPVYSLGKDEQGRPFYAMRFIQGENLRTKTQEYHIKDWSKEGGESAKGIEFRRLLNSFVDVCQAIHYAHTRGVLHRDIKPSNIMIGNYGETLVVDWGLAKCLGGREFAGENSQEATLLPKSGNSASATKLGAAAGTPAYMSPEQARGEHDRLRPATDIYGLGATLFFLLSNRRPFEEEDNTLNAVRSGKLERPRQFNPSVPKPLESICIKAMAFLPDDRYASALALADDIERYLGDEVVAAHKDGTVEKSRRWIRKNSAVAASLSCVGLMLLVLFSVLYRNAVDKEESAIREAEVKREILEFVPEMFRLLDGQEGRKVTVVQVLDNGFELLNNKAKTIPESDFQIVAISEKLFAVGRCYSNLGLYEKAHLAFDKSLKLASIHLADDDLSVLDTRSGILLNQLEQDRGNKTTAGDISQKLQLIHKYYVDQLGPASRRTLRAMNNLAMAESHAGNDEESVRLFEECHTLRKKYFGSNDEETLTTAINLAKVYTDTRDMSAASRIYSDAELEDACSASAPKLRLKERAAYANNKGYFFYRSNKFEAAREQFAKVRLLVEPVDGPTGRITIDAMHNVARSQESLGNLEGAETIYRDCLNRLDDNDVSEKVAEYRALQSAQLQLAKYDQAYQTTQEWKRYLSELKGDAPNNGFGTALPEAEALIGLGRYGDAKKVLDEVSISTLHPFEFARYKSLLGYVTWRRSDEDSTKSSKLMLEGLNSFPSIEDMSGHYRWYVLFSAQRLAEFHEDQGGRSEIRLKLDEIKAKIASLRQ